MNEHFIAGFQKEAAVMHSLGKVTGAAGKLLGAAAKKGGEITRKVRTIPAYMKANYKAGVAGKKSVSFSQAESGIKKQDAIKRGLETKSKNQAAKKLKQEKQLEINKKRAATKASNKAKTQEKIDAKVQAAKDKKTQKYKDTAKTVGKAVAVPAAVVGGTYAVSKGLDASKNKDQSRYQYAR